MSFQNLTPESLVQRSDSKNPSTTCRGITSGGKPCRRSLASPRSSPAPSPRSASRGVVAVIEDDNCRLDSAAFYCWQHKDQAQSFAKKTRTSTSASNTKIMPVEGRTSMDSLVARLGVASIQESTPSKKPRDDRIRPTHHQTPQSQQYHRRPKPKRGFWASLCCAGSAEDADNHHIQVRPRPETVQVNNNSRPAYPLPSNRPLPSNNRPCSASTRGLPARNSNLTVPSFSPKHRRAASAPTSTTDLLPFIPGHLPPQTTSLLLTELSKPISPHDEAGYIYIFWLTESDNAPSNDTAASLLAPSAPTARSRRPSDVMSQYVKTKGTRTIKLKIGRANNVHRRMNEWNRQCGYSLSLVRFYPYISSSSPSPSPTRPVPGRNPSDQVHKVPHAHRVERLVHLELADKRIKRDCAACGREHKEWFEIEATAQGVGAVDEVVRRWVRWAEANP